MNVDDNPSTPSNYDVRGIPNLIIFKGGEVVEQIVGAVPKDQLTSAIEKVL
jgi:thioredoxin 1